jgi:DNA mismatch endonuclease (patch repair protein)
MASTGMTPAHSVPQRSGVPIASSERVRERMQSVRRRDTEAELALRSALHRMGFRFRIDVAPVAGLRRRADIVFSGVHLAVFVDGCFWHACPKHGSWPKANSAWWKAKIENNAARDRDTDRSLRRLGWRVRRVWAHEEPVTAARRIGSALARPVAAIVR